MLRFQVDPTGGMGGGPPAMIGVPPPGGGDIEAGPAGPPDAGGGQPGPDSPKVADLINQAADLLTQAMQGEKDPGDKAVISKIQADLHKFVGDQQGLVDKAMGAGPGVKMIRKASGPPSGGGGSGY